MEGVELSITATYVARHTLYDKALAETGERGSVCYTSHTPLQPGHTPVTLNTLAMRW